MGFFDALWHVLGLIAPAFFIAVCLPLVECIIKKKMLTAGVFIKKFAILFVANTAVLCVGFILTGRDGKMLTYAAMLLATALIQTLSPKIWK
jgi:hypothetical protein